MGWSPSPKMLQNEKNIIELSRKKFHLADFKNDLSNNLLEIKGGLKNIDQSIRIWSKQWSCVKWLFMEDLNDWKEIL